MPETIPPKFEELKAKQRRLRDRFPEALGLRVHRAISWLGRAERETDDLDAAFIFYWISFNSAYAADIPSIAAMSERSSFGTYLGKLIELDRESRIYSEIWNRFSGPIRMLLDNQFIYQPYWNHQNGIEGYADWSASFEASRELSRKALARKDTQRVLSIVFDRLYVLRNQLLHGGATWNSRINRAQVGDGTRLLASLIPIFIDLMLDHPEAAWGAPYYPVSKN
jgi:hypothetical protein